MILDELRSELQQRDAQRRRELGQPACRNGAEVLIDGKRFIDFTSWDILGLATHPAVKRALHESVERDGLTAAAARTATGNHPIYLQLERQLALFMGDKSALLFSSRNQAFLSMITAVACERDVFLLDEAGTLPVADAAWLAGAEVDYFSDPKSLVEKINRHALRRAVFVVLEGLNAVTGNPASPGLLQAGIGRPNVELVVDESAALGVLGVHGAGALELSAVARTQSGTVPLCRIVDLSFSLCGYGAAIVGPLEVAEQLIAKSRTFAQETPPPLPVACSMLAALELLGTQVAVRERIVEFAKELRRVVPPQLLLTDFDAGSPFVTMQFERRDHAEQLCGALRARGIIAELIPQGRIRKAGVLMRMIVSGAHSPADIVTAQRALQECVSRC